MEHSEKCLAKQKEFKDRIEAYLAQYPNCCRSCGAAGVTTWYERIDERGGFDMAEPCDHCIGQGKCPRCGELVWDVDSLDGEPLTCPNCGWNENDGMMPPEFDSPCECEEEEMRKWDQDHPEHYR